MVYKLLYAQVVEDDTKRAGVALAVHAVLGGGLTQEVLWMAHCKLWSAATVPKPGNWVWVDLGAPAGQGVCEAPPPPIVIMKREKHAVGASRDQAEAVWHRAVASVGFAPDCDDLAEIEGQWVLSDVAYSLGCSYMGTFWYAATCREKFRRREWEFYALPGGDSDE